MATLSELHFEALSEIIRISTNRAVQGLSEVIGEAVQPSEPNVEIIRSADVSSSTLLLHAEKFGVVTQKCTGGLNAKVLLLFAEETTLQIVRNMMGSEIDADALREVENEAMCELGNIMINACLSSIADLLHSPIESSLPHYVIQSGNEIAELINTELVIASHVDLVIEGKPAENKLFFLVNSQSLDDVVNQLTAVSK